MSKKIIFSLILFVGVFFAFGIRVKAVNCFYHKYDSNTSGPDSTISLNINNYGTQSATVTLMATPEKITPDSAKYADLTSIDLLTEKKIGFYYEQAALGGDYQVEGDRFITFSGDSCKDGKCCPLYVGFNVHSPNEEGQEYNPNIFIVGDNIITRVEGSFLPTGNTILPVKENWKTSGVSSKSEIPTIFTPQYIYGTYIVDEEKTEDKIDKYEGLIGTDVENTCEGILGKDFVDFMNNYIFLPLKIIVPILFLIFTILDFSKAVFAEDKDALKHAQSKLIKRAITVVLLFLLTYVLDLLFAIVTNGRITDCFK